MCDAACPAFLRRCVTCFGGGGGWGWNTPQVLPGSVYPPLGAPAVDWTQFHTFAVQWNETALVFSVDGHNYHTKTAAEVCGCVLGCVLR